MASPAGRLFARLRGQRGPLVRYRRRGGFPPPDLEVLEIDDSGAFSLWRTVVRRDAPPVRIGRFAGELPGDELASLKRALAGWRGEGEGDDRPPPDAAMETIRAHGASFTLPADAEPPPERKAAVELIRTLVDRLIEHPRAAVGLEAGPDGASLVHEGSEALRLDLSRGTVRVVCWDGDELAGSWSAPLNGPREEQAVPGWRYALPFSHGLEPGTSLSVAVEDLLAFDGDFWCACALEVRVAVSQVGE